MRRLLLPQLCTLRCDQPCSHHDGLTRDHFLHLFSLPIVELRADVDVLSSKAPLEDMLNLAEQDLLLLLVLLLNCLLSCFVEHLLVDLWLHLDLRVHGDVRHRELRVLGHILLHHWLLLHPLRWN